MYKEKSSNFLKIIVITLGGSIIASNFYSISLLNTRSQLPIFNLPVSKYSAYDIEATKEGYKLSHRMHDPLVLHSMTTSKKPAGFLGGSKATVNKSTEVIAGENVSYRDEQGNELDAKTIACIEQKAKGESTGQLVGTSVATGTGLATQLTGVPIIGWLLGGFAVNTARKEGGKIGKQMAADFSDC